MTEHVETDQRGAKDFTPEQYEETILAAIKNGGPVTELLGLYAVTHPIRGIAFYDDLKFSLRLAETIR